MNYTSRRKANKLRYPYSSRTSLQQNASIRGQLGGLAPATHVVSHSPGESLSTATRKFMEARFNHDFSGVRVHTDGHAARSAGEMGTRAYAMDRDLFFGSGHYQPESIGGQRLIAHELSHVAQQENGGSDSAVEERASAAADRVMSGMPVSDAMLGGAPPGVHTDDGDEGETVPRPTQETRPVFSLGWADMARAGMLRLTPPVLLAPSTPRLTLGSPRLGTPAAPGSGFPLLPPPQLLPPPWLPSSTPPAASSAQEGAEGTEAPSPPSRLPVVSRGNFSLGLRLGFPTAEASTIPGMPPSALSESLLRAQIINQALTGSVPSGWEAVDKGQLVRAVWGIFSTNIAPDLARSITSSLSTPAGPAGTSFELDVVLLTDFSSEIGGGLSFTVRYPSLQTLFTGRP